MKRCFDYKFIDVETGDTIHFIYLITPKDYCMRETFVNGDYKGTRRISENEYINAYDCYINA